jgi:hypothetical protein
MRQQLEHSLPASNNQSTVTAAIQSVIDDICGMNWSSLSNEDLVNAAWVYYYFSVHFCETVGIARALNPDDLALQELDRGERNTDNLSPWPGVVTIGERVDHCEFMRRSLLLSPIAEERRLLLESIGEAYLRKVRAVEESARMVSLASYEDGGLEKVFRSILKARRWDGPLLQAFKHFLVGHIELDSDPECGHGSLCRHLKPDWETYGLWVALRDAFVEATPALTKKALVYPS